MRVKEAYYDHLELLAKGFGNKKLLRVKEVAEFLGIDVKTAKKRFPFNDGYISIVVLARALS